MKYFIKFLLFFWSYGFAMAQDIHFSQFGDSPLNLNPALTGVFNGDFRLVGNYRNQWSSVTSPFVTSALSVDFPIAKTFSNDFLSTGLSVFTDKAGDLDFRTSQGNVAFSYNKALSKQSKRSTKRRITQTLSIGGLAGMVQKKVDPSKMIFDSQFDGYGFSQAVPNNEGLTRLSTSYPDLSAGILWSLTNKLMHDQFDLFLGAGLFHINKPKQTFLQNGSSFLSQKWVVHGGSHFGLNSRIYFLPTFMFLSQGPSQEIVFGSFIKYMINPNLITFPAFYLGAWYRNQDAAILVMKFNIDNVMVGYSYDLNTSGLMKASNLQGGSEISVTFITPRPSRKKQYKRLDCPVFGG